MNFMRIICLALILSFVGFMPTSYAEDPYLAIDPWDNEEFIKSADQYAARQKARKASLANMKDPSFRFPTLNSLDARDAKLSHGDLDVLLLRLFSATNGYIENVNKSLDETAAAAKSCDRAKYDAAKRRLIRDYTKASLYLRRQMDNIDALVQASNEWEENYDAYRDAKRTWSLFWAAVHENITQHSRGLTFDEMAVKWEEDRSSSRYMSLGRAYNEAYHAMLERMEEVLRTADYPPFEDCKEPVKGPTLAEANAALAEAMNSAVQYAMEELYEELHEQDGLFKNIKEEIDQAVVEADLPSTVSSDGAVGELPIFPDPKQNADGSFQTPDFGELIVTPDVEIDVPDTSKMEAMLKETAENMKDTPLAKFQADPCGHNPKKVCNVLLKDFRKDCTKELKAFFKICKKAPSINDCKKRCEANWQQGVHELALAGLAQKHIYAINGYDHDDIEKNVESAETEIKDNEARIKQIEEEAQNRVIHIYINTNTDMVIRHNGNKFEPKAPLRYGGTEGGSLRMYERSEIEYLKARNKQLNEELDALVDGVHDGNAWFPKALSKWTPNDKKDDKKSDGFCTAPQNDANRDACMAECNGKPAGVTHSCYSSYVPQLALPYGRTYLYPPGHPESDPAKGLK